LSTGRVRVMQPPKLCPKCNNPLERGELALFLLGSYGDAKLRKRGDVVGDNIVPFHCRFCGYVEFYNAKYTVGF